MEKRRRKKLRKNMIKKRRERRSRKTGAPILRPLLLPSRPMVQSHYLCVWPSLVAHLSGVVCLPLLQPRGSTPIRNHATVAAISKLHPHMLPISILRYAKVTNCSPTPLFMLSLWKYKHAHTYFSCFWYMLWFGCIRKRYIHRRFKLSMVLRLKLPSLIKLRHGV